MVLLMLNKCTKSLVQTVSFLSTIIVSNVRCIHQLLIQSKRFIVETIIHRVSSYHQLLNSAIKLLTPELTVEKVMRRGTKTKTSIRQSFPVSILPSTFCYSLFAYKFRYFFTPTYLSPIEPTY